MDRNMINIKPNLGEFNIIQASEDARINESAFLQLENIRLNEGDKFNPNQPYYLERVMGGSLANAEGEIRNSLEKSFGVTGDNANKMCSILGENTMRFIAKKADASRLGGFTYNKTKAVHDKLFSDPKEFRNSLIDGVPFTFGANMVNFRTQMPEQNTYDFLSKFELGAPTGNTLFGSSEIITLMEFGGEPTDITNGSTTVGHQSVAGGQLVSDYKVLGYSLSQLESWVAGTAQGYAGDNLIQNNYGRGLEIAKAKLKTQIMRDFYNTLAVAKDSGGNFLCPTYTLADIDVAFNGKTLTDVFSTASGAGEFITKILRSIISPENTFLETNQAQLSRMVMHTSFRAVWERGLTTLPMTGATTGETFSGGLNLKEALKEIKVHFGGDITVESPSPLDLRILAVADPNNVEFQHPDYGFAWVVVGVAPTVMATYGGTGFTNQTMIAKYTLPRVLVPKRAMFLVGSN